MGLELGYRFGAIQKASAKTVVSLLLIRCGSDATKVSGKGIAVTRSRSLR